MLSKTLSTMTLIGLAYWGWSAHTAEVRSGDYATQLKTNAEMMQRCVRSNSYVKGNSGAYMRDPKQVCAEKYELYYENGNWHRYADVRPAEFDKPRITGS